MMSQFTRAKKNFNCFKICFAEFTIDIEINLNLVDSRKVEIFFVSFVYFSERCKV